MARTAKRLGAEEAAIVYRRTRERMPAEDTEIEEALEEGVLMKWLSTVRHAEAGVLMVERMELDEKGSRSPPVSWRGWRPTPSCSHSARMSTCPCWTACRICMTECPSGSIVMVPGHG